jgi:hypothetical protein
LSRRGGEEKKLKERKDGERKGERIESRKKIVKG